MNVKLSQYGILGQDAPELKLNHWIDKEGKAITEPIRLSDKSSAVKIIFCFQNWCPSCHTRGFPAMQQILAHSSDEILTSKLMPLVVQTVFEGRETNTADKLRENQINYKLKVPFAHDEQYPRPSVMTDYRHGGTPWFSIISKYNKVIYSDFHIDTNTAVKLIKNALSGDKFEQIVAKNFTATDDIKRSRFTVQLSDKHVGFIDYQKKGGVIHLNHAEIPPTLRGKSYGAILMESALEEIERQGLQLVANCRYVNAYVKKFKRWEPLLAK